MEQAIISLVGFGLALMIYLDRVRRADFERLDHGLEQRLDQVETKIEDSARRTDRRINKLNRSVIELAKSVGRVEGRTEVLSAVE